MYSYTRLIDDDVKSQLSEHKRLAHRGNRNELPSHRRRFFFLGKGAVHFSTFAG